MTWNPFTLALPEQFNISLRFGPRDAVRNVILFLPVGFLYCLTQGSPPGAILLGLVISTGAEIGQLFIPARTSSPVDLITNTSGAALGAALHNLISTRIAMSPRLVGRLALEVPLMGLLYLLVPLLWVNRLTAGDPGRWLLTILIGMCGALVLSDTFQQWWGPPGIRSVGRVALAAASWFFVGIGPGLFSQPVSGLAALSGIALLTALLATLPRRSHDHRFERVTLLRLLPLFATYLILAALWPPLRPIGDWHAILGIAITDQIVLEDVSINFRLLEYLAAFTVLGYIAAEWRGRAEIPWRSDLPRLMLAGAGCALILELLVGFQSGPGASLLRPLIALCGAFFGGTIYHLQRDYVRSLLGRASVQ